MLIGESFGKWTIKQYVPNQYRKSWLCVCQCGTQKVVRESYLLRGSSKSCGCTRQEVFVRSRMTHGLKNTALYKVWNSMKNRCLNNNCKAYKNYGARGISIADEWLDFKNFYDWCISNGYKNGLEIDRKENDGNYEPSNCRFVTPKINANNRRTNFHINIDGVIHTLSEWSNLTGINRMTLKSRVLKGLRDTEIIQPLLRKRS